MGKNKKDIKLYSWLLYWTLVLALVVFAIIQVFKTELIAYLFGGLFVIIGLSRIAPFVINNNKLIKWLNFGDLVLNIGVGAAVIVFASKFGESNFLPILIGSVFFVNGAIHFFSVSVEGGKNYPALVFFMNLIELTFGTYIIFTKDMDVNILRFVILGCLIGVALIFFVFGYNSFMTYYLKVNHMTKEEFKKARKENKKNKKEKKNDDDNLENEALKVDPTLEYDEEPKDEVKEEVKEEPKEEQFAEEEPQEQPQEEVNEESSEEQPNDESNDSSMEEPVEIEKDYMEDRFVKLDDLINEKKNDN